MQFQLGFQFLIDNASLNLKKNGEYKIKEEEELKSLDDDPFIE